ncbi:MAG: DUF2798 domain-containing protein [Planctomycetes bacterium]|nr:DUF2798 domain-containing protein [Planctomycetota bacterium]
MKLSRRHAQFLYLCLLALAMSCATAFANTFVRSGFEPGFVRLWLRGWAISFVVALPTLLFVAPIARAVSDVLTGTRR